MRECVEIAITKPLKAGYTLRGTSFKIQYEGLNTMCFRCGKYGPTTSACPKKSVPMGTLNTKGKQRVSNDHGGVDHGNKKNNEATTSGESYGVWMTAQRSGADGHDHRRECRSSIFGEANQKSLSQSGSIPTKTKSGQP